MAKTKRQRQLWNMKKLRRRKTAAHKNNRPDYEKMYNADVQIVLALPVSSVPESTRSGTHSLSHRNGNLEHLLTTLSSEERETEIWVLCARI